MIPVLIILSCAAVGWLIIGESLACALLQLAASVLVLSFVYAFAVLITA